jgi:nitroreductase
VVCRRGDENHRRFVQHLSRGNSGWVPKASLVIVTLCQTATDPMPDAPLYSDYAEYDTGQAAAHLTLQAHAMGLRAHQFGGFDKDAVAAELGVPGYYKVMAGIAIGVPGNPEDVPEQDRDREHRPRHRRPLARMAHGPRWGVPWAGLTETDPE